MASAGGSNLQKKLLDYARDYAFDQIGKKLDKARAKQQQQQRHMSEEQGENTRIYIDDKNEVRMIERSGYQTRSEQTRYVRSDLNRVRKHPPCVSYIQVSSDHSDEDEDDDDESDSFLTAEEEDEEDFKIAREFIRKNQRKRRVSRSVKSGMNL